MEKEIGKVSGNISGSPTQTKKKTTMRKKTTMKKKTTAKKKTNATTMMTTDFDVSS